MIDFDAGYARLPARFYARVAPTPVAQPTLLRVNGPLAELLGVDPDALASSEGVARLAGNRPFEGSDPIAAAYAGHQFGHFVPQLGDGRAILLGDVVGRDGVARELQLKGAGPTPFSRGGDGRAAIGPVLREYLVSEAMAALGIPTTRALAAVATGESVYREEALPGAVLARVATSHLRVGTFEYFAARRDHDAVAQLVEYALARHYPDAKDDVPALALLDRVITAQAELVARWLGVGFVHGVMNTDNCSIAGETIDYGPCAFLDAYDPKRVFSSIDRGGRYAFEQQPRLALWNLARLAEALLPLVTDDEQEAVRLATERLETFPARFEAAHAAVLRAKLGLLAPREGDLMLARALFDQLAAGRVDFTRFFRWLADAAEDDAEDARLLALFPAGSGFPAWLESWRARLRDEPTTAEMRASAMRRASPAFIPRNHRVEEMIEAAIRGDLAPFERLLEVLARPYDDQPEHDALAEPPGAEQWSYRTFCGT
ncbi:MAG: YdiU family protein [Myxococcales bacterium]|nr:YdiU family protein [Myxococcales bacterium]